MKKFLKCVGMFSLAALCLVGCVGGTHNDSSKEQLREKAREKSMQSHVSNIFYSLPSPLEVAHVVQSTGVDYEPRILHKTELGVRYSTNMSAAVNLGIYGADLSYSIYFGQQQIALKYLDCIKNLASGLDISDILTQSNLKMMEENISDQEALKKLVSKTFFHSDALLKENSRRPTAVMIVMGMWIESLYISAELSMSDPNFNPGLSQCIVEQGMVFDDLMGMLDCLDESPDVVHIKEELNPLKDSYIAMNKALGGSYVLHTETGATYDKKLFVDICSKVKQVRSNFTQLF